MSTQTVSISWRGGEHVLIAGEFNGWLAEPMRRVGENWVYEVDLEEGSYQYKFVVDGNWRYDRGVTLVDDKIGNVNNILIVGDGKSQQFAPKSAQNDGKVSEVKGNQKQNQTEIKAKEQQTKPKTEVKQTEQPKNQPKEQKQDQTKPKVEQKNQPKEQKQDQTKPKVEQKNQPKEQKQDQTKPKVEQKNQPNQKQDQTKQKTDQKTDKKDQKTDQKTDKKDQKTDQKTDKKDQKTDQKSKESEKGGKKEEKDAMHFIGHWEKFQVTTVIGKEYWWKYVQSPADSPAAAKIPIRRRFPPDCINCSEKVLVDDDVFSRYGVEWQPLCLKCYTAGKHVSLVKPIEAKNPTCTWCGSTDEVSGQSCSKCKDYVERAHRDFGTSKNESYTNLYYYNTALRKSRLQS